MNFSTISALFNSFLTPALRVVAIFLIAFLANRLAKVFINKMAGSIARHRNVISGKLGGPEDIARLKTLKKALSSILSAVIWIIAVVTLLPQVGIDITPILAALGVGGLALGLAAQNVIRDYIIGVLILLEDQFRVDEEVEIAGKRGLVKDFNLRRVILKTKTGEICFIPNSQISSVLNFSRGVAAKSPKNPK